MASTSYNGALRLPDTREILGSSPKCVYSGRHIYPRYASARRLGSDTLKVIPTKGCGAAVARSVWNRQVGGSNPSILKFTGDFYDKSMCKKTNS